MVMFIWHPFSPTHHFGFGCNSQTVVLKQSLRVSFSTHFVLKSSINCRLALAFSYSWITTTQMSPVRVTYYKLCTRMCFKSYFVSLLFVSFHPPVPQDCRSQPPPLRFGTFESMGRDGASRPSSPPQACRSGSTPFRSVQPNSWAQTGQMKLTRCTVTASTWCKAGYLKP